MNVSHIRISTALALSVVMVLAPLHSATAQSQAARYIAAGERLYAALEYERALDQLAQARRLPRTLDEDVRIALFEGLILSDMGKHEEARIAFKSGLLLDIKAQLPVRTSPKVEQDFEVTRSKVQEELASQQRKQKKTSGELSASKHGTRPYLPPIELPLPVETPSEQPEKPQGRPSWLASSVQMGRVSVPTPALVLAGAGAIAGGAGSFFGVKSRDQLQQARDASFRDEMVTRHGEAVGNARAANILFGTAMALATSAVVTWVLSDSRDESREEARQ